MTAYPIVLACLCDVETTDATLDLAFRIGRDHGAQIRALHVKADASQMIPLVGEGMSGAMFEEMLAAAEGQGRSLSGQIRDLFEQKLRLADAGAPGPLNANWCEMLGREDEVIARVGRLSDLLVMAHPAIDRDSPSMLTLNAALMETGRPVLLAPARPAASVGKKIAVFWNGSAEAVRALAAARPFLAKAEKVWILSVKEGHDQDPGDLASYLAWHGITAQNHPVVSDGPAGPALMAEAVRLDADLVVMGAYTHSRLRQLILGGVTRQVLRDAPLPVLLCH
ncbi:MAG TPA: universal stress protein [Rhodospirillaceae bacterium]|nr:universal stress protein [Rhodospirillaceae bacterium]